MARNTATDGTIVVEHDGVEHEVPRTFERGDLATWFGDVPDEIEVERVYYYDGHLRAEGRDGDDLVEVGYFPDAGREMTSRAGWVAEKPGVSADNIDKEPPGTVLWTPGDEEDA
jgi:hypothetical protein